MADALVLDMPVELGLEFMPVVCPDLPDPEWECSNHMVNEVDGIGLGVALVDFEGADTGCVIDGGVLKATDRRRDLTPVLQRPIEIATQSGHDGPTLSRTFPTPFLINTPIVRLFGATRNIYGNYIWVYCLH